MIYQTEQLRALLRKKYAMPEYFLAEEVRDAAGFDGRRSVDALAMGMWAGRGLHITGFEIKASRGDWLKEKACPRCNATNGNVNPEQAQIEVAGNSPQIDHDWEFQDDSFDHAFGTERIHYFQCKHCEATRPMAAGDYSDEF